MPPKWSPTDGDDLVERYLDGASVMQLAREHGVTQTPIRRYLRTRGIRPRNRVESGANRRRQTPPDLVNRYIAGESILALSKTLGVARTTITQRLLGAGVQLRTQGDAETLKWRAMTAAERGAQVAAAHAAVRGAPHTTAHREKIAATIQARAVLNPGEALLADMLTARGIATIPQQAIGPYNCDLGAKPVAVEVFGGDWHWSGRHLLRSPERFRYILNAGWHVLVVHVSRRYPLGELAADYVVGFVEEARRSPAAVREYRVIRGTGQFAAGGRADDNEIAIVKALGRRLDAVSLDRNKAG